MMLAMAAAFALPFHDKGGFGSLAPLGLYVLPVTAVTLLEMSAFSEHAKARWIWRALPVSSLRPALQGAVEALLLGTGLPFLLLAAGILLAVGGARFAPDVLLAVPAVSALALAVARRLSLAMPFTRNPTATGAADTSRLLVVFGVLGASMLAALLHALASMHPISYVAALVAAVAWLRYEWRRLDRLEPAVELARARGRRPRRLAPPAAGE